MMRRLQRLFRVQYFYTSPLDRHRASVLLLLNLAVCGLAAAYLALVLVAQDTAAVSSLLLILAPLTLIAGGIVHRAIQRGYLLHATRLFVASLVVNSLALTIFADVNQPTISQLRVIGLMLPVVVASLLLKRGGVTLVLVLMVAAALLGGYGQSQQVTPERIAPMMLVGRDLPLLLAMLVLGAVIVLMFMAAVRRLAEESVTDSEQRQWVIEYGLDLSKTRLAESVILARALTLLHDRFGYDFAQIFLYDADQSQLRRVMSTGLGQQDAVNRGGFGLSETNIISESARLRQPVLALAGTPAGSYLRPTATFGAAVPILHGTILLGVLDVQDGQAVPFSPTELETLTLLAAQIGAGLDNARQFGDMQRQVSEQENLVSRLQTQVAEYQEREQRSVSGVWGQYLEGRGLSALGFDITADDAITPVPAHDLPDDLRRTLEQGSLHIETRDQEKIVYVPIIFRNQTLGAMAFRLPVTQELTSRQIEMAQVVAERLALALENTRLFEQSQAQAQREQKAGQITGQLIGAKDVDALLKLAADRFNEVLGAVHTRIYLQPDLLAEPPAAPEREEAAR